MVEPQDPAPVDRRNAGIHLKPDADDPGGEAGEAQGEHLCPLQNSRHAKNTPCAEEQRDTGHTTDRNEPQRQPSRRVVDRRVKHREHAGDARDRTREMPRAKDSQGQDIAPRRSRCHE